MGQDIYMFRCQRLRRIMGSRFTPRKHKKYTSSTPAATSDLARRSGVLLMPSGRPEPRVGRGSADAKRPADAFLLMPSGRPILCNALPSQVLLASQDSFTIQPSPFRSKCVTCFLFHTGLAATASREGRWQPAQRARGESSRICNGVGPAWNRAKLAAPLTEVW